MAYQKKYDYEFVPVKKKRIFRTKTGKKVKIVAMVGYAKRRIK